MHNMPPEVARVFQQYSPAVRDCLLQVRQWIGQIAAQNSQTGGVNDCLKWGEPSYLTIKRAGTTLRLSTVKHSDSKIALLVHCQTRLIADFKEMYPQLEYEKNRAVIFDTNQALAESIIKHFIFLALTYHLNKTQQAQSSTQPS